MPFRPPRTDGDVDLAAHLAAMPAGATTKGLFCQDYVDRVAKAHPGVDLFGEAGVEKTRFVPFKDYPYTECLKLQHAAARLLHPELPIGGALRKVGNASYDAFLKSHVGRVVFGVFGANFSMVARVGMKGWQVSMNFGKVSLESIGDHHACYRFEGMPIFLETVQLGVIEGAMWACGLPGGVFTVEVDDIANARIAAEW